MRIKRKFPNTPQDFIEGNFNQVHRWGSLAATESIHTRRDNMNETETLKYEDCRT